MIEYSSLINLNAFAASNVLTPALVIIIALHVVGVLAIIPIVKLHWAKMLWECYNTDPKN